MRRLVIWALLLTVLVWLAEQPRAQFNSFPPGVFTGRGAIDAAPSGGGCSQATAFIARTSGLNGTHQTAYTTLICGLVTDGVWSSLDVLYIFATADTTTAKLNLTSSSFTATGTPATFTVDQGFTPTDLGTDYLDSGFNATTAPSPNFVQNSAMIAGWSNTAAVDVVGFIGTATSDSATHIYPRFTGDKFLYNVNGSQAYTSFVSNANGIGFYASQRDSSSAISAWKNGASVGTASDTSGIPANVDMLFGGSAANSNGQQIMAGAIGAALTSGHHANLCARIDAYLETIAGISHTC
jgi:hypothetical protein